MTTTTEKFTSGLLIEPSEMLEDRQKEIKPFKDNIDALISLMTTNKRKQQDAFNLVMAKFKQFGYKGFELRFFKIILKEDGIEWSNRINQRLKRLIRNSDKLVYQHYTIIEFKDAGRLPFKSDYSLYIDARRIKRSYKTIDLI